ncbi:bacterial Ig-like domain-containing protein [Agathobaculum butyriciproducens]|uniref:bacterial Ig-like domain-containing protein n=1 Tax=Agathobaculum butyriciproducens TaxID=1628085 RepID=UPI003AAE5AC6
MKKQWLSIVLVLCMVLCMAPATALAAEGETGTLKITVDLSGLYDGVDAGGKTFSFEILRKYANYGHYKDVDITIKQGETEGTMDVPVEAGKYIVKQTSHATIDGYDWKNASHQPGNNIESNEQEVFADKTKSVTVHNFYELAVTKEITELPIKINGYALNAKAGDIEASTDQMRVDIHKVTIKQRNASGGWDDLASDATIQANTQYAVEIFVNAKPEYTYTELTKDKVTVNGETASEFEKNPSTQPGVDMRVFHELEVLQVVKTVKSIEITTPPTKTEYMAGDKFDPKGMVVTAHYTDGTTADLTENDYTIFHGDKLTQGQTYVTIQYNDGSGNSGIKVDQKITVGAYEGPHTHTYAGSPWYSDENSHWHQCTDSACPDPRGSTKDLASHTFVWKVDKAATETQTGLKHEECTVCKKVLETATIPATHTHSYGTDWKYDDTNHWHECECGDKADVAAHSASEWIVDTAATETADGAKHKECTVCKKVLETEKIPATGSTHTHSYGTDWKYDDTNHWHECECRDKADTAAHSFQWVIDKAATKKATGIKHEECTVCGAKRSENTVIDKLSDNGSTGNTGSGNNNTDKPGKDDSTKSPQTGDSSNLIGWLAALFVSGGVLTVLGMNGKKRKESEAE